MSTISETNQKIQSFRNDYIDEYGAKVELERISQDFINQAGFFRRLYYSLFAGKDYTEIKRVAKKTDEVVKEWNRQYVEGMKHLHLDFFSDVEGLALDDQQQEAIITDDNYNLVIAGAGSGKTLTVAAKVKYLTEIKGVKPEDILLLSFTKKAAGEMTERIKEKLGVPVTASTFHSLGNRIILESEGKRTDIETEIERIVEKYFREEVPKDNEMIWRVLNFIGLYLDYSEFDDSEEAFADRVKRAKRYNLYTFRSLYGAIYCDKEITELKKKLKQGDPESKEKIQKKIRNMEREKETIAGERVKSIEEAIIANFFFLNGIRYRYESEYPHDIEDNYRKRYRPDFYLPDYDIYWEHFGVNEEGQVPWLSEIEEQKYLDGIQWKRELHRDNNTRLVESYSYYNKNGQFEERLKGILKQNGIEMKPIDFKEVYDSVFRQNVSEGMKNFQKLVVTFIGLFKSNGYKVDWFSKVMSENELADREMLFFQIVRPVYEYYQKTISEDHKIDFNDMINKATEYVADGKWRPTYRYIIVDEYQDISVSRYRLLKAMIDKCGAKLLCVGDDWQSIYRFTGSDLGLLADFNKYWGKYQLLRIEKTYRNSQQLIDIASSFVLKNHYQIKKNLRSDKRNINPVVVIPYTQIREGEGEQRSLVDALKDALDSINRQESGKEVDVMLLGRNNFDINSVLSDTVYDIEKDTSVAAGGLVFERTDDDEVTCNKYPNLHLSFYTVHRSKGLQADYVIILNLKDDVTGFPNQIVDDPLLRYVLSDSEDYDYAEERRLFYVALTRTKNQVYLLSPTLNESAFVKELMNGARIDYYGNAKDHTEITCPKCKDGRLVIRHGGYSEFLGCSNYPICDYTVSDSSVLDQAKRCSCGGFMIRRNGKRGAFLGCSNYPFCKRTLEI